MSKLCLENVQFLSENNLDGFDFILDEFANEYNYLENINEASISDTISKAIDKLKELWKSFVELIKDTVRKIKIKAIQMLAKLKLKRKEEKSKDENSSSKSSENETKSANDIKLLPAKTKTSEDDERILKEKEKERREQREKNNNNHDTIEQYSVPKEVIFTGYSEFVTCNVIASRCSVLARHIGYNGLISCLYCIKDANKKEKNDEYENVFENKYEILHSFNKNFDISNIKNDPSIKDIIRQTILGDECRVKAIFNDKNGYRLEYIIAKMIDDLDDFEYSVNRINSNLDESFKRNFDDIMSNHDDIYNRHLISEIGLVVRTAKDTINELLNCHIIILKLLFGCSTVGCEDYSYKCVTFTKA